MQASFLLLCLTFVAASSSIVSIKSKKIVADEAHLKKQKQILDIFVGLGYNFNKPKEDYDYDVIEDADNFSNHEAIKNFRKHYEQGNYLTKDEVFSMSSDHTRENTIALFDILFFAKGYENFYNVACWAKKHLNSFQFYYAFTLALIHREDCQHFIMPPLYEIFPTYFVPQDVFLQARRQMITKKRTGTFFSKYTAQPQGPLSLESYESLNESKLSYFREDIEMNTFYFMWHLCFPSWMDPKKYNKPDWIKRGEGFYYVHQQLLARYNLERLANGLPYVEKLFWNKPIKTGYNPNIQGYTVRPDNMNPLEFNKFYVLKAQTYEDRIINAIAARCLRQNNTLIDIYNDEGIDHLGNTIYGSFNTSNKQYFGAYHYAAMDAIAYIVRTGKFHNYVGGPMVSPATSMRDPAFYNYLNRLVRIFQWHKQKFYPYTQKELGFPGVSVKELRFDKLITYFDYFGFEMNNGFPVKTLKEFTNLSFYINQNRLNHIPFTYYITITSESTNEGMVRLFVGPKYDSEDHILTLEQKRMLMVELDRFPVKMTAGKNVYERQSSDSPIYQNEYEGFRIINDKIESAFKHEEPFVINKTYTCGIPQAMKIPLGTPSGRLYSFFVIVTPFVKKYSGDEKQFQATYGSPKLFDYCPYGYPFDRPINEHQFHVANIFQKDFPIYYKTREELKKEFSDDDD